MDVLNYTIPAVVVLAVVMALALRLPWVSAAPQRAAAFAVGGFGLIAITPLCGLLFQCGCAWPWQGLHYDCNYFETLAKQKCPWCDSTFAGTLSMLVVFGSSVSAAFGVPLVLPRIALPPRLRGKTFAAGVLAGVALFHGAALVSAVAAAKFTGYRMPASLEATAMPGPAASVRRS